MNSVVEFFNWILSGLSLDPSAVKVGYFTSITLFLLGYGWRKILAAVRGSVLFLRRKRGGDPYVNLYGDWYYYRHGDNIMIELTLSITPRWFNVLPSAVFDTKKYNGVLASKGEVFFSDSNIFITLNGMKGDNSPYRSGYPFLIVLKAPHPSHDITLGTVSGQLISNGKAYSAPVLISRKRIDIEKVRRVLDKTTIVDDKTVRDALEKIDYAKPHEGG